MGKHEGGAGISGFFSFCFLLSWKNCCIASEHSEANTPRRIVIFGWNGWAGACGLSVTSEPLPPSPPLGKSLQNVGYMSAFKGLSTSENFFSFPTMSRVIFKISVTNKIRRKRILHSMN